MDEATIAKLKAQYGDSLASYEYEGNALVLRCPSRHEHARWLDKQVDGKRSEAARELAQCCVVYPDSAALTALLDKYPALLTRRNGLVDVLLDLAGADGEPTVKKL
jgi:hypothetical protein